MFCYALPCYDVIFEYVIVTRWIISDFLLVSGRNKVRLYFYRKNVFMLSFPGKEG